MAVTKDDAYKELDFKDLNLKSHQMSKGSRSTWLKSFLKDHLPTNRLKAKEDDISLKYESLDCKRKKKKKSKSRAAVGRPIKKIRQSMTFKPGSTKSFSSFLKLQEIWTKYMEELMQIPSQKDVSLGALSQKILKADLHGCFITVRKSRCPSYIGTSGIIVQETRNMFILVTPDDKVKSIPKAHSIFTMVLHDYVFTIYGNQFLVKPGDRAAKKFKSKPTIDL